jgi:head-tail adaptor
MITDYFVSTFEVKRKTVTVNDFGGQIETWATSSTGSGMIDYLSGQKAQVAEQYADKATHILICPMGVDVTIHDRILCGSEYYRVLHVDSPFDRHMEILLEYVGVDNNG